MRSVFLFPKDKKIKKEHKIICTIFLRCGGHRKKEACKEKSENNSFSNFSCRFLNPNNFFQFEL